MGYWEKHGLTNPEAEDDDRLASYEQFATDKGGPEPLPGGKALLFHPDDEKIDASELDKAVNTSIEPEVNEEDIEEPEVEIDEPEIAPPPIPVYKGRVPEGFEAQEEDEAIADWEAELVTQEASEAVSLIDHAVADNDVDDWDDLKEKVNTEDFDNKPPRGGSRKNAAANVRFEDSVINKRAEMRFKLKQKGKAARA